MEARGARKGTAGREEIKSKGQHENELYLPDSFGSRGPIILGHSAQS